MSRTRNTQAKVPDTPELMPQHIEECRFIRLGRNLKASAIGQAGQFSIPFAIFQNLARGEAVSAPLLSTMPDLAGGFA